MSPVPDDEVRCPLSPVQEPNLLAAGTAPPPLELPPGDLIKGENQEGQEGRPRTVSRAMDTPGAPPPVTFSDAAPPNAITPITAPPDVCVASDEGGASSMLSPYEQTSPPGELIERRNSDLDDDAGTVPASVKEEEEEESCSSDEDAVMALLSLQRVPSAVEPLDTMTPPASVGGKRRAESPADYGMRHSPVPKLTEHGGESRYFCRYPGCGKGYASTDAVRKHCRQRHLEWLRRLGHGCPALYCRCSNEP